MFKLRPFVIAVILTIVLGALVWSLSREKRYHLEAKLPLTDALKTDDTAGFARALQPQPFSFEMCGRCSYRDRLRVQKIQRISPGQSQVAATQ